MVGYASQKSAYRVYNKKTREMVESYYVDWLEENPTDVGSGPDWLFNYSHLFNSFNQFPVASTGYQDQVIVDTEDE